MTKTAVAAVFILAASAACSRSEQTLKTPQINMITRENVHGVMATDERTIWITGKYGIIYHSSDGGATWQRQESGVTGETVLCDGTFPDSRTGWVVGIQGTILHTTDGGATWRRQATGTDRHLYGICFVDARRGWAVGEWGTVLHTTDGGATWLPQAEEVDRSFNNVVFVDGKTGWIVGERGVIRHTTDGGTTWLPQVPRAFARESFEDELEDPPPSLFGVCFTDARCGWACGIEGTVIRTTDGGATWDVLPALTDHTLYTVFIRYGRGWIVGDKGTLLLSGDAGLTWENRDGAITSKQPFRDVFFTGPQTGWAVGGGGSVVHTADGGATWDFRSGLSYAMEFFQMPRALEFGGGTE